MGAKVIVDISAYQSDTLSFFNNLKNHGVYGVIIKLTEGSNPGSAYLNPRAKAQYINAKKAGLKFADFIIMLVSGVTQMLVTRLNGLFKD